MLSITVWLCVLGLRAAPPAFPAFVDAYFDSLYACGVPITLIRRILLPGDTAAVLE